MILKKNIRQTTLFSMLIMGYSFSSLNAQEELPAVPLSAEITLDAMVVIGSAEDIYEQVGSASLIDQVALRETNYSNVNRVLAKVPGVYVREEDGFGNFPNISIRGGDGTRNEKTTVMEDGILSAPATYSAPGAYYSPRAARMSGIEVLKGSSQVRFGPHTTGGIINYRSTPVPTDHNFYLKFLYGSENGWRAHSYYGDILSNSAGEFGYLLEIFAQGSDGYRSIDSAPRYAGSDDTGFRVYEPMFKLYWEPNTALRQRFELKLGYTDFHADETYTGLTERDFARNQDRRYAGTLFDNIGSEHSRSYLKYAVQPSDSLKFEASAYYNEFERDWYKIRKVGGESIHKVLADTSKYSDEFGILRLRRQGDLGIRANARQHDLYGVQSAIDWEFDTAGLSHKLHAGLRHHIDTARRFQRDDKIVVDDSKRVRIARGEQGSGGNRYEKTAATSLWLEDSIEVGRLKLRPGLRYESLGVKYTDFQSNSKNLKVASAEDRYDYLVGGFGMSYQLSDLSQLYGGIYQGSSVPAPRSFLKNGIQREESLGYELGMRHRGDIVNAELVGFYTDFDNLIGSDSGLGGSDATNAGAAEVYGMELALSTDFAELAIDSGSSFSLPAYLSATYTVAELQSALSSGGGDDIWAGGRAGARIPYVPEWKLAAGVGIKKEKWGVNLDVSYTSESFGTALNLSSPSSSAHQGIIDESFLVDLSAHYYLADRCKLVGGIQNLFDERGVVSRIPEGARAGAPRHLYLGFEITY